MDEIKKRKEDLLKSLDIEGKKNLARQIETESIKPDFWQDSQHASARMKELASIQKEIESFEKLEELIGQGNEKEAEKLLLELEEFVFLSGEHDAADAILSIHAGQGGVEAMDWTQMLFRMYSRYIERMGWGYEVIDQVYGEEAGLKSVSITVEGRYAYGFLKNEAGVHRLVRLSPFNADQLRQTSFALVEVMPQIQETNFEIKEDDLEWDFFRSGGHGGQNVNKVSTAVRLRHIPSGIVVTAQSERYQGKNREYALKILRAKLWAKREEERKKEEARLKGGYKTPGWGNQIRSYVLHPYKMVKDLRTSYETSAADAVLNGDLDGFIDAALRSL